jgi:hypothetical protein
VAGAKLNVIHTERENVKTGMGKWPEKHDFFIMPSQINENNI